MAITIAQQSVGEASSSPATKKYVSAQTKGNTNVCFVANFGGFTNPTDSLSDSAGNLYTRLLGFYDNTALIFGAIYYCLRIKAATANSNTVTFSYTGQSGTFPEVWIVELAGGPLYLDTLYGIGGSITTGTAVAPSTSYKTGRAPDGLLGYCFTGGSVTNASQGAGWAQVGSISGYGSQLQSQLSATPAGTFTASCNVGGSSNYAQSMIAFTTTPPNNALFFGSD